MHILLTDVLTCPRCGPEFGLIVLADRMEDRRVMEGRLGCANCREEYPVSGGAADLRVGEPVPTPAEQPVGHDPAEAAFRVGALLGVSEGAGTVLLLGASPELVDRVAELLPHAQVVGASTAGAGSAAGAGWILHGPALPFRDRSLRGAAVLAGEPGDLAGEAARILAPGARLVLDPAPPEARQTLEQNGLSIILDQEGVVVASTPGPG